MLWGIFGCFSGGRRIRFFSLDAKGESMHQRLGRFLVRPVNNAIKGLAGNTHALRRVLIVKSLAVSEPHGLQFVGAKSDLLNLAKRNPSGLKIIRWRAVFDSSGTRWPRHKDSISHPCEDLKESPI